MSAENALPQEETPNSATGGAPTADYSIGDGATAKLRPGIQSPADLQNLSYEQLATRYVVRRRRGRGFAGARSKSATDST